MLCHLKVRNNCVGFFRLFRRKAAGMLAAFQGSAASHGGKKTGDNFRYLPDGVLGQPPPSADGTPFVREGGLGRVLFACLML